MPYVSHWPPRRLLAVTATIAAGALALIVGAPAAAADTLACPTPSSSQVFSQFGDNADYSLVPGGNFEGDMSGWTLSRTTVVAGNEPWYVGGAGDSRSLSIEPGGSAISPAFCVTDQYPSWRFFARVAGGLRRSYLAVAVQWTDQDGDHGVTPVTTLRGGRFRSWRPTGSLGLGPVLDDSTTMIERLAFSAGHASGWRVDDLYIDPYAKR